MHPAVVIQIILGMLFMVPVKVNLAPEYTPTLTDELDLQCNGQLVCPPSQQVVYSLQVSTDERRKIKSCAWVIVAC